MSYNFQKNFTDLTSVQNSINENSENIEVNTNGLNVLENRVNTIETSIEGIEDLPQLILDVSEIKAEFEGLDLNVLNTKVNTLETDNTTNKTDISTLQTITSDNSTEIDSINDEMKTIESSVDTVNARCGTIESSVVSVNGRCDLLNNGITTNENRLNTLDSAITAVENEIGTINLSIGLAETRLNLVELINTSQTSSISSLTTRCNNLETKNDIQDDDIALVNTKANTNESNISSMNTTLSTAVSDIVNIKSKNVSQDTSLSNLTTRITDTETDITDLELVDNTHNTRLNSLDSSLISTNSSLSTINSTLNNRLNNITTSDVNGQIILGTNTGLNQNINNTNILITKNAKFANSSGSKTVSGNVIIGENFNSSNSTGAPNVQSNIIVGLNAMQKYSSNNDMSGNLILGNNILLENQNSYSIEGGQSRNILLGNDTLKNRVNGSLKSVSDNIIISNGLQYNSGANTTSIRNALIIDPKPLVEYDTTKCLNTISLGNSDHTNCTIAGISGKSSGAGSLVYIGSDGKLGTSSTNSIPYNTPAIHNAYVSSNDSVVSTISGRVTALEGGSFNGVLLANKNFDQDFIMTNKDVGTSASAFNSNSSRTVLGTCFNKLNGFSTKQVCSTIIGAANDIMQSSGDSCVLIGYNNKFNNTGSMGITNCNFVGSKNGNTNNHQWIDTNVFGSKSFTNISGSTNRFTNNNFIGTRILPNVNVMPSCFNNNWIGNDIMSSRDTNSTKVTKYSIILGNENDLSEQYDINNFICINPTGNTSHLSGVKYQEHYQNSIMIGNLAMESCYIQGIYNRTASSAVPVIINSKGQLGTVSSSIRYKENVHDISHSEIDKFLSLPSVSFNYKNDEQKSMQYGSISESTHELFPELCHYKDGIPETVYYQHFNALLLATVKRQSSEINSLNERLSLLESKIN